jgi:hypothetical protein
MKNNAYIAYGENPIVLCSYGVTPGRAMKKMGKLIDSYVGEDEETIVLGVNCSYDEDGTFCMNVTLSKWG